MSLRSTVATAPASYRVVFRRLGVRARSGYDGDDVARRGETSRGSALWRQTDPSSHLPHEFCPNFQTQVLKGLNTKVAKQLTLYKIAKGSRVV
jgi:hypothetical protein